MVVKYVLAAAVCGFAFSAHAETKEAAGNGLAGALENAIFSTTLTEANRARVP